MDNPTEVVVSLEKQWKRAEHWQYNAYFVYEKPNKSNPQQKKTFTFRGTKYTKNEPFHYGSYTFEHNKILYKIYSRNKSQGDNRCIIENLQTHKKRLIGRRTDLFYETPQNPTFKERLSHEMCRHCMQAM